MQLAFLAEKHVLMDIPSGVTVLQNWGDITAVFYPNDNPNDIRQIIQGEHVMVEGERETILAWLKPFSPIPVTQGSPMLEEFRLQDVG